MKKTKFTESQIVAAIKIQESGIRIIRIGQVVHGRPRDISIPQIGQDFAVMIIT